MAGRHSKKNRRAARDKARARRAALGLGSSAGAFLAFGLTPLASVPPAHADGLDVIIDPIINSILSSVTSFDALLGIDPSSLGDLALPATDAATATSAQAFGGMSALVAAAKKEGQLNAITLPRAVTILPWPAETMLDSLTRSVYAPAAARAM